MPRRCMFCGGRRLSREHVLPRWISRQLVSPGTPLRANVTGSATQSPDRYSQRPASSLDIQVRQVCTECNGGCMNDLEVEAKPWLTLMMKGRLGAYLTTGAKRAIAAWSAN